MRYRAADLPFVKVTDGRGAPIPSSTDPIKPAGGSIRIETDRYLATIATEGYVSGVAAGSFLDKATGARDLGFGLSIVDFLLEPASPDQPQVRGQYDFGNLVHGNIAKRYVEGPQICTQAKSLPARVLIGDGFVAITLRYRWEQAYPPRDRAGSVWEQTLIFPRASDFFSGADRVTTVSASPALFFRVDMPGHIKHKGGAGLRARLSQLSRPSDDPIHRVCPRLRAPTIDFSTVAASIRSRGDSSAATRWPKSPGGPVPGLPG